MLTILVVMQPFQRRGRKTATVSTMDISDVAQSYRPTLQGEMKYLNTCIDARKHQIVLQGDPVLFLTRPLFNSVKD